MKKYNYYIPKDINENPKTEQEFTDNFDKLIFTPGKATLMNLGNNENKIYTEENYNKWKSIPKGTFELDEFRNSLFEEEYKKYEGH